MVGHKKTCFAIYRTILEQYQQEDGSVIIPKILIPYMNGISKLKCK